MQNYLHELLFGALIGNLIALGGIVKLLYKIYKRYDLHMHQHDKMWEDYLYRESLRKDRININLQRKLQKGQNLHLEDGEQENI
jgi:hypothetical protein